jgi:DNA-directed RNA polymerase subunit beta'
MAFNRGNATVIKNDFRSLTITLASPDSIKERSRGEVTKPETINYRTYKPERDGLFCEKVFGPVKDYECYCGKYKRIRYKGTVCDRCGVEVTEKKVRRERMGHIALVVPVVHIWYFRSLPNKIGYLLGMSSKNIESIVYYEKYVVIQAGNATGEINIMNDKGEQEVRSYQRMDLLTEEEYLAAMSSPELSNNYMLDDKDPNKFIAKMGGESIKHLLASINLDELSFALRNQAQTETSRQRKQEALKRLSVVEAFREANTRIENKPEWTVISLLPVVPPELRPLVPLDGGRFASSDLNDLYRRVIIRNNRLKRLIEIKAPEVILRNEKRMLQEAVDSLFDNSRKSNAVKAEGGRALKSISDSLKGKQGRFRQNLLGKRVDYSGRSVIVVGPNLQMHECGLPKDMAAELFKPFIIRKLIERGIVRTVKSAKKLVDRKDAVIWDILENILKGHPVLLNRAPTLHRLSIQAFMPKLVEGKAIRLHPLVTTAFNADFDGDQMAVHVPLSNEAILEGQLLMLSSHNILNPQNGTPVTLPSQDMVLGLYYMTNIRKHTPETPVKGAGSAFYSIEEVIVAYNEGKVDLHAPIRCRVNVLDENGAPSMKLIETSVGRVIANQYVPEEVGFINQLLSKKALKDIISDIIERTSVKRTAQFLDDIKNLGFYMAFKGGLSFNLEDVLTPEIKPKQVAIAKEQVAEINSLHDEGHITERERYNQVVDTWEKMDKNITIDLMDKLKKDKGGFNSIYMMLDSGARGSRAQIKQLGGVRGLMNKPKKSGNSGEQDVVENPILSSLKEGLSAWEYFISTHGARKGLADTALKTADAGYLTRRLVDVAQSIVIYSEDCGTLRGIETSALMKEGIIVDKISERIMGRTTLHDIYHPNTDELLVTAGEEISKAIAAKIEAAEIEMVEIRSVLTCESSHGVCVKCYGRNLATNRMSEIGDAVGVIAAQSIGEPGTQLTLRTFHTGGIASLSNTVSEIKTRHEGIIRLDSVRFIEAEQNGEIKKIVIGRTGELRLMNAAEDKVLQSAYIPYGSTLEVTDGDKVGKEAVICTWDPFNNVIIAEQDGTVEYDSIVNNVTFKEEIVEQTGNVEKFIIESRNKAISPSIIINGKEVKSYSMPVGSSINVDNKQKIKAGTILGKIPRMTGKSGDITGGLPRVTELFEARNPLNPAKVAEVDGVVTFGGIKRGNREIVVTPVSGEPRKYLVPLSSQILVQEQDYVRSGTPLSDGTIALDDILRIKGVFAVQSYLVNEVQEVYQRQSVKINDKHIETIVRQMMSKVLVDDPGDTSFLEGESANKFEFLEENDMIFDKKVVMDQGDSENYKNGQILTIRQAREENSLLKRNDKKLIEVRDAIAATATPLLEGITKTSFGRESWISAASFQETTKVLSLASISARRDNLVGLKENVIVGQPIPAGTGFRKFNQIFVNKRINTES